MKECATLIAMDGSVIYMHDPHNSSSVAIPDSVDFWTQIWNSRSYLLGIAHSHPGSGIPVASNEDLTTFEAIEQGIGRRLVWWITSSDQLVILAWEGPEKHNYRSSLVDGDHIKWLLALRLASENRRWFDVFDVE